jgi:hypothetical protein
MGAPVGGATLAPALELGIGAPGGFLFLVVMMWFPRLFILKVISLQNPCINILRNILLGLATNGFGSLELL